MQGFKETKNIYERGIYAYLSRNSDVDFEARKKIITDLNQCKEKLLSPFNKKIYIRISQHEISKKMF